MPSPFAVFAVASTQILVHWCALSAPNTFALGVCVCALCSAKTSPINISLHMLCVYAPRSIQSPDASAMPCDVSCRVGCRACGRFIQRQHHGPAHQRTLCHLLRVPCVYHESFSLGRGGFQVKHYTALELLWFFPLPAICARPSLPVVHTAMANAEQYSPLIHKTPFVWHFLRHVYAYCALCDVTCAWQRETMKSKKPIFAHRRRWGPSNEDVVAKQELWFQLREAYSWKWRLRQRKKKLKIKMNEPPKWQRT